MKHLLVLLICITLSPALTQAQSTANSGKLLRHVVLFKFKESSSAEDVDKVVKAFTALPSQISVIKGFEWGLNKSPEHYDQGFTHCFIISFASEHDRDEVYQKHPAHKAFQDVLKPHMDKVFVVDYWAEQVSK